MLHASKCLLVLPSFFSAIRQDFRNFGGGIGHTGYCRPRTSRVAPEYYIL